MKCLILQLFERNNRCMLSRQNRLLLSIYNAEQVL